MLSTRSVQCGVSSREAAPISRANVQRSQWCTAARFPASRLAQSGSAQPDISRQLSASALAAVAPIAPPPAVFRNAVNAGIKKAGLPASKVLHYIWVHYDAMSYLSWYQ